MLIITTYEYRLQYFPRFTVYRMWDEYALTAFRALEADDAAWVATASNP